MERDKESQWFVDAAERVYAERLKSRLESEHLGELIALEPVSGDFVLGQTFHEISSTALQQFGVKRTYIFRIGGGGAIRIGPRIRAHGRAEWLQRRQPNE
jgi:hypothetical protein